MATKLTKKQKGFVKDYIETGIGSLAVKKNYNIVDDNTARNIASENLTKPNIVKAIQEALPDELLATKHLALLNKIDHEGEIDVQAVTKGLDMAYKLKGSYAAEKSTSLNVNVDVQKSENPDLDKLREEYEEKLRARLIS